MGMKMSNVVKFAKPKEFPAFGADQHRPQGHAEADISELMGAAIDAQEIARRGADARSVARSL
jgi:hypothetical protein